MTGNTKLLVAVPTMGTIHPLLVQRLIGWGRKYKDDTISFYFTYYVSPVDRARNQIAHFFLEKDFTHLLTIDSDTIPPEDAIDRLLSHDKDVVSGLTPILRFAETNDWEMYDNCFAQLEQASDGPRTHIVQRHTGLHKIFRCGGSCMLIKRRVFEGLAKPYFKFIPTDDGLSHTKSEDIYFSENVVKGGFELYADSEVICTHHKTISF